MESRRRIGRRGDVRGINARAWTRHRCRVIASRHPYVLQLVQVSRPAASTRGVDAPPPSRWRKPRVLTLSRTYLLAWGALILGCAGLLSISTGLAGFPNSLRGFLGDDGSFSACVVFVVAMLWFGVGAVVVGERARRSALPWLALPLWTLMVGLVSLVLIEIVATAESISALVGGNQLYDFLTVYGVRTESARALLEVAPLRAVIDFIEHATRYVCMFGLLFIALGLAHVVILRVRRGRGQAGVVILYAIPWLWLCKGIAFDWPAAEHLYELNARLGSRDLGGDGYFYGLLMLIAGSAGILAHARGPRWWLAGVSVLLSLPLAWWFMLGGLEPEDEAEQHDLQVTAFEFLLRPDQSPVLDGANVAAHGLTLYLVIIVILAAGMRLAIPLFRPKRVSRRQARLAATPGTAASATAMKVPVSAKFPLQVRLLTKNAAFLSKLAEQLEVDIPTTVQRILEHQLRAPVAGELRAVLANSHGGHASRLYEVQLLLDAGLIERIDALAQVLEISHSRVVRRLVSAFIENTDEAHG
jgi:hypothetical protein